MQRVPSNGPASGPASDPCEAAQLGPLSPVTSQDTNTAPQEFKAGDRGEDLDNFGEPMAIFGAVEEPEEYSVVVLWDDGVI